MAQLELLHVAQTARLPEPTAEDDDFYTPKWLLAWLPPVGLDPCWAPKSNVHGCRIVFDLRKGMDGLAQPWLLQDPKQEIVWCNPPYSDCARWVARCREQSGRNTVVALIPAKPGENYWHDHVWGAGCEVGFLRGRVRFDTVNGPAKDCSTFGLALVVWGHRAAEVVGIIDARAKGHPQRPVWMTLLHLPW